MATTRSLSDSIFDKVCRLCGNKHVNFVDIFGKEGSQKHLQIKILTKLDIDISLNDPLPNIICRVCSNSLERFVTFHERCHIAQNTLMNAYIATVEASTAEEEVDNQCSLIGSQALTDDAVEVPKGPWRFQSASDSKSTESQGYHPTPANAKLPQEGVLYFGLSDIDRAEEYNYATLPSDQSVHVDANNLPTDNSFTGLALIDNTPMDTTFKEMPLLNSEKDIKIEDLDNSDELEPGEISTVQDCKQIGSFVPPTPRTQQQQAAATAVLYSSKVHHRYYKAVLCKLDNTSKTSVASEKLLTPSQKSIASSNHEHSHSDSAEHAVEDSRKTVQHDASVSTDSSHDILLMPIYLIKKELPQTIPGDAMSEHTYFAETAQNLLNKPTTYFESPAPETYKTKKKMPTRLIPCETNADQYIEHISDSEHRCTLCSTVHRWNYKAIHCVRNHTGESPFKCEKCPKAFKTNTERNFHQNRHGPASHICTICGKALTTRKSVVQHELLHGDAKFPCAICGYVLKSNQLLSKHITNKHKKAQPQCCYLCGKTLNSPYSLTRHLREHRDLESERYKCLTCSKVCPNVQHLKRHYAFHVVKDNYYTCQLCKMYFTSPMGLISHKRSAHSRNTLDGSDNALVTSYQCDSCSSSYSSKHLLRNHILIAHGEVPPGNETVSN